MVVPWQKASTSNFILSVRSARPASTGTPFGSLSQWSDALKALCNDRLIAQRLQPTAYSYPQILICCGRGYRVQLLQLRTWNLSCRFPSVLFKTLQSSPLSCKESNIQSSLLLSIWQHKPAQLFPGRLNSSEMVLSSSDQCHVWPALPSDQV